MTYEILYTSAPAGLKPGSSGYCTVKGSRGIPSPTLDLLESLSGYRHVFTPGTPEAAHNPVNWGHYLLRISGRLEHVLSRVSDCEPDYTGRSNKLAHHMVVDSGACPAGPAWLLSQRGWMTERWDGQVEQYATVRTPPAQHRPPARCVAWESLGIDPGWAGVMAEAFLADPERKVFVIYKPGTNLLPLFEEALSLLPENRRWDVTFATYGPALPSTVECLWSGIVSGSPEVQQSKRFVNALRINLTLPLPPATGGELVEMARTGVVKKQTPTVLRSTTARSMAPPSEFAEVEPFELLPRPVPVPRPQDASWEPEPPALPTRGQGSSSLGWWVLIASLVLVVSGIAATATYLVLNRNQHRPLADGGDSRGPHEKDGEIVVADSQPSNQVEGHTERTRVVANENKPAAASPNSKTPNAMTPEQDRDAAKPSGTPSVAQTQPGSVPAVPMPTNVPPSTPSPGGKAPNVGAATSGSGQPMSPPKPNADDRRLTSISVITSKGKASEKGETRFDFSADQKISAESTSRFSLLLPRMKKTTDGPVPHHDIYRQRVVDTEIRVVSKTNGGLEVASSPLVTAEVKVNPLTVTLTDSTHRDDNLKACLSHGGVFVHDPPASGSTILLLART